MREQTDFSTPLPRAAAVALGNFDGLHRGHREVVNQMMRSLQGEIPAAFLFQEHTASVLAGQAPAALLTSTLKDQIWEQWGIQLVCRQPFSLLRHFSGKDFVQKFLFETLHARVLSCGYNYRFGENASCGVRELEQYCKACGIRLLVAKEVCYQGDAVSSTRIRSAIEAGDLAAANAMLGRPFSYDFPVVAGDRRGRTMGFPTINQVFPSDFVHPRFGVYASVTEVGGASYPSVTNFGVRPTFETTLPRSETCILGFHGDLYGQRVKVGLLDYLRGEVKFDSLQSLQRQIGKDSRKAEQIFGEWNNE